jgi:D-threo-aldose 1-dehydrogenase
MSIRDKPISGPPGFGSAPLGNMFRNIPEEEAAAPVDAAWQQGIRYFDTAPLDGAGPSEMRLDRALAKRKRGEYVLSSKAGRLSLVEVESGPQHLGEKGNLFELGQPNRMAYDYSADGTPRSIEDSLKRLGIDRQDFVWTHDLSRDFHGDEWLAWFETARTKRSQRSPNCKVVAAKG